MKIRKRFPAFILAALASITLPGCADANDTAGQQAPPGTSGQQLKAQGKSQEKTMKIRLKLENTTLAATLDDNATARDFVSLLPLTLTLKDHAQTEKSATCRRSYRRKARPQDMIPALAKSRITRPGAIWPSITRTSSTQADSSSWESWIPASKR